MLPEIALAALGGTIAAVPDSSGRNATMTLGVEQLIEAVPRLAEAARLRQLDFRQGPSAALRPDDIAELAALIVGELETGAAGAVVTQGTDTLEETAYLLDLLLPPGAPVVVTGAMRNSGLPGADGPANLLASVQVAASEAARGLGVLVVMNDEVHAARFVRKTHSSSPATFRSPQLGPLGWITEGRVSIPLAPRSASPHPAVPVGVPLPEVGLVRLTMGDDGRLVDAAASAGYAGLVVEVFGAGHVPVPARDAMRRASAAVPVVFASRTGAGELYRESAVFPGSERDLLDSGIISAGWREGLKARLLLSVLLASGAGRDGIAAAFASA